MFEAYVFRKILIIVCCIFVPSYVVMSVLVVLSIGSPVAQMALYAISALIILLLCAVSTYFLCRACIFTRKARSTSVTMGKVYRKTKKLFVILSSFYCMMALIVYNIVSPQKSPWEHFASRLLNYLVISGIHIGLWLFSSNFTVLNYWKLLTGRSIDYTSQGVISDSTKKTNTSQSSSSAENKSHKILSVNNAITEDIEESISNNIISTDTT